LLRVFGSKYFNADHKDALLDSIKKELGDEIFERVNNAKNEACEILDVDISGQPCSHGTTMFLGEKLQVKPLYKNKMLIFSTVFIYITHN
jgi:hypothetical protein